MAKLVTEMTKEHINETADMIEQLIIAADIAMKAGRYGMALELIQQAGTLADTLPKRKDKMQ